LDSWPWDTQQIISNKAEAFPASFPRGKVEKSQEWNPPVK
jgi:hypothetical protein